MNKIKLLYDVAKTMKEKELINGALILTGTRDQAQFLSFNNQFQRNFVDGEIKARVSAEFEVAGKKIKNETSVEFNSANQTREMQHHWRKPMGCHHGQSGMHQSGIKHKLTAVAFFLNLLDTMQVSEQEDKTWLSLTLSEIPEEFKTMHAKMHQGLAAEHHIPFPLKDFAAMEKTTAELTLQINKRKEVEKIAFKVNGKQQGELNAVHDLNLQGELQLVW